ncbi:ABC transporter ATP-binding protein [Propioniciclava soli]|uniref:ABC transporter ATP-binding protein n=1 Tax=Propioniciclava soli TaxID=2775081 RepID=A0ABZ3C8A2_9ACTN|nr:ABC transporter ATP-binding protein [Propioniciclava soli]
MDSILRALREAHQLTPRYVGIVITSVLIAATALLTPYLTKLATDEVVAQVGGGGRGVSALVWIAAGLLAVELANTLLSNIGGYLGDTMSMRLRAILSSRYYNKLLGLPQRYFDTQLTGTIINRLNRSIIELTQFLASFSNNFFPTLITVVAVLVIAGFYYWPLALLLFIVYPLFTWLTMLTSKRWQTLEGRKNLQLDLAGGRFAEAVGQIRVVKSFVRERDELDRFDDHYRSTVATTHEQSRWWHLMDVARRGSINVIFFGIYVIIFVRTAGGEFTLGDMVMLLQLMGMARTPVMMMSYLVDASQHAIAGTRSYFEVMDELPEPRAAIGDVRSPDLDAAPGSPAAVLAPPAPQVMADPDAAAFAFEHVRFGYDDTEVLRDITFAAAPGERIALVSESGGGKTTLVNLLLGLYAPDAGTVRLGGVDASTMPLAEVRARTGVVFQDASLFSGTIAENITYGRPGASRDAIVEAARRAHAHDFIARLANGYDAEIGERGIKLSGGQKQRIAVARAMLKDAPLLVLDEATSSLDSRAERLVQAGLEELMAERTSLIIAHRLSTISTVDRIITLRDGRIDEVGSPEELADSGGIYAELLALQASNTKRDRKRLQRYDITG